MAHQENGKEIKTGTNMSFINYQENSMLKSPTEVPLPLNNYHRGDCLYSHE